jgi:RNA polymerase sigma-70 factor, ECF subfamily
MTAYNYDSAQTAWKRTDGDDGDESQWKEFPEENIIRRAQQGDSAAFERIYELNSPRIFGLCLRMVGNASEAEDLTQEAFLLVFRKIRTFRGESAFSTWLYRLSINVVLMHLRKKKLRWAPLEGIRELDEENRGREKEVGGPDTSLTGLLDRFNLERAVDQLSPTCKMVFVLHDIQGYKHQEIAGMMDSSVGTSKGRLHRARTRLRELLQESLSCLPIGFDASRQNSHCQSSYGVGT